MLTSQSSSRYWPSQESRYATSSGIVTCDSSEAFAPGKTDSADLLADGDLRQTDEVHHVGKIVERQFPESRRSPRW